MNRRQFLKLAVTGLVAWQIVPVAPASPPSFAAEGPALVRLPYVTSQHREYGDSPNVLMIVLDDQNDWVGCLNGHPDTRTPNIDRLAQRGTLFRHAYCPAPLCNPSRTSFLTGLHPTTSGVYDNTQSLRDHLPSTITLPQYFKGQGYYTLGGGKIFHYADPVSWHEYFPFFDNTFCFGPVAGQPPFNGINPEFDWGPISVSEGDSCDGRDAIWATTQFARSYDRPFFLALGIVQPHTPWYLPAVYFEMFPPADVTLPPTQPFDQGDLPPIARQSEERDRWVDQHGVRHDAVAAYLAAIAFADAQVGLVLDALDASPHAENTVVVLCGDNGYHLGTKQHWEKWTLWEEATHVPLIIAPAGAPAGGQVCTRTVGLLDLYPTLLDLCGLPARRELDGRSLLPLLVNPQFEWEFPVVTSMGPARHAVRSERWRTIHYEDGSCELYDHITDPWEWTNLAPDPAYAEIIAEHAAWLPAQPAPSVSSLSLASQ